MKLFKTHMVTIEETEHYQKWFASLRDIGTKARIDKRLRMIKFQGHFGDIKSVGSNVYELRFFFGAGYRIYYRHNGNAIILLLAGGDKSTQAKDIQLAITLSNSVLED